MTTGVKFLWLLKQVLFRRGLLTLLLQQQIVFEAAR
jgi:hypothetical protein